MALKKNYEISCFGVYNLSWGKELAAEKTFVLPNAYIKVYSVDGTKKDVRINVQITSGEKTIGKSFNFAPNMEGRNFIAQAYEHLKTLPEFAGATDC
jgi:hypothetical protein